MVNDLADLFGVLYYIYLCYSFESMRIFVEKQSDTRDSRLRALKIKYMGLVALLVILYMGVVILVLFTYDGRLLARFNAFRRVIGFSVWVFSSVFIGYQGCRLYSDINDSGYEVGVMVNTVKVQGIVFVMIASTIGRATVQILKLVTKFTTNESFDEIIYGLDAKIHIGGISPAASLWWVFYYIVVEAWPYFKIWSILASRVDSSDRLDRQKKFDKFLDSVEKRTDGGGSVELRGSLEESLG
jgi:hypothetical protein